MELGWSPRTSNQRCYPKIYEHKDFIRAYLEIHSKVGIITIWDRRRNRTKKQLRLRIYGNMRFLSELTDILASEIGTGVKKVQQSTKASEVSGTLYCQSQRESITIISWKSCDNLRGDHYDHDSH